MNDLVIEKPLPCEVIDSPFHKGNVIGVVRHPGGGRTFISDYALPITAEENERRKKKFAETAYRLLRNQYINTNLN